MHDLSDVRHIKRIVVGSDNPARLHTKAEIDAALEEVNGYLTGCPRGTLLAIERSFVIVHVGEHQVVLQWMAYHIGFPRRPPPLPVPPQAPPACAPTPFTPPADVVLDPMPS
jgi:hypothetical protein